MIDGRQANPTIGKAINGGDDLLEAKCKRCRHLSLVPLRSVKRPVRTPTLMVEDALFCEPCSEGKHYTHRQRAFIVGVPVAGRGCAAPGDAHESHFSRHYRLRLFYFSRHNWPSLIKYADLSHDRTVGFVSFRQNSRRDASPTLATYVAAGTSCSAEKSGQPPERSHQDRVSAQ